MESFSAVWEQIVTLLDEGISVIPVRDKDETIDGKVFTRKSPYFSWKEGQRKRASKEELWYQLDKYGTNAVGTICGKVSENLEAIDVDVHWEPGIDKLLFDEIKAVCPEILGRLRINKSPSGGWHLLYRVEGDFVVPGNRKIASRTATEEELIEKPKEKVKCYIETRGEGGYVVAPPSIGYITAKANPLPVLTIEERDTLIAVCEGFNRVVKEDTSYRITNADSTYYDINPFEHYNNSAEGEQILIVGGWKFLTQTSKRVYYSRPGSKSGGIHAVYFIDRHLFYFFTTNSEMEPGRCYKPATVLGLMNYGGDKKKVKEYLRSKNYGVPKKEIEKSVVKRAVLSGNELPANFSEEAREQYKVQKQQLVEMHPYGTFWDMDEKGKIEISRERIYDVCHGLGFRMFEETTLVQIVGKFIYRRSLPQFYDLIKEYIKEEDEDIQLKIFDSYEAFIQKSGEFTAMRMRPLEIDNLVLDTKETAYKFFEDGYQRIDNEEIEFFNWENLHGLVWEDRIQKRLFKEGNAEDGVYYEFLKLAVQYDKTKEYVNKILGYLSHGYKDEAMPYIVVCTEACEDPKDGGGSGKNVFTTLLKNTTTVGGVSGTQVTFDSKFLQAWNMWDKVFVISEIPKRFDFLFMKELSSGSGVVKKLYKDEITIPVERMPKFVISTNYSYDVSDGGLKRRIIPLEFTNFFTECGGVNSHFGCMFPSGWEEKDWAGYDRLIAESIQSWIKCGMEIKPRELTETGNMKYFTMAYGSHLFDFFESKWGEWSEVMSVPAANITDDYNIFCKNHNIEGKQKKMVYIINNALQDYVNQKGWTLIKNKLERINGIPTKMKIFIPPIAPF